MVQVEYLIYSIEDDKDIAQIINKTLTKQGFKVVSFPDGTSFFKEFKNNKPDMILLDMMLPDYSGTEILKTIRSDESNDEIEIIIISANHMIMDKVEGLDLGADDYIEKPFDLLELMSRVSSKLRRHKKRKVITAYDITLDLSKRECYKAGQLIDLTNKEFDILKCLLNHKGDVVDRDKLFKEVWGNDNVIETRTLDMHIKALRSKIDSKQEIIKTVYGIGYRIA